MDIPIWFNVEKANQMAFYLTQRNGGPVNKNRLAGLIYLVNRCHMQRYGFPVLDDDIIALRQGPVNRVTYAAVLGKPIDDPKNTSELSDAEIDTLAFVWREFGCMGRRTLLHFARLGCPEWSPPDSGYAKIPYEAVFRAIGCSDPDVLAREIEKYREIEKLFSPKPD